MRLTAGDRLGPYEIKSVLGTGGMGEVYRARDTKLHRDVAIKVLPDLFAANPDWLARYVRRLDMSEPAIALSRDAGEFPVFLHDGRTLALVRGRQLVVRSWRENNGRFEIGPERQVAPLAFGSGWTFGAPYDVAPGGRFLALVRTEASPPPRIRVVVGWDPATVQPASR